MHAMNACDPVAEAVSEVAFPPYLAPQSRFGPSQINYSVRQICGRSRPYTNIVLLALTQVHVVYLQGVHVEVILALVAGQLTYACGVLTANQKHQCGSLISEGCV